MAVKKRAKKTTKRMWLRFRKNDVTHNLLAAAQHYIYAKGGDALVIGGIAVMDEGGYRYRICVAACGKMPEFARKAREVPLGK